MNDYTAAKELIGLAKGLGRRSATKPSIVFMMRFQQRIEELKHDLWRLPQWGDDEVADPRLGKDLDALRQHLDNASGRCSTCIQELRSMG